MKEINAFQCNYCTKIYESKDSCRSHEYRCYFNPKTKSCASCVCLKFEYYKYKLGHSMGVRTCLKNMKISEKLLTGCEKYCSKAEARIVEKINETEKYYDPIPFVMAHLKKHGILVKNEIKVNRGFQERNII